MGKNQILDEIVDILGTEDATIDVRRIRLDDTPLTSYGIDSLRLVRLACAIEDRFGITIDDGDAIAASTVVRLVDLVESRTADVMVGGRAA
jgi:acyl carrier protein